MDAARPATTQQPARAGGRPQQSPRPRRAAQPPGALAGVAGIGISAAGPAVPTETAPDAVAPPGPAPTAAAAVSTQLEQLAARARAAVAAIAQAQASGDWGALASRRREQPASPPAMPTPSATCAELSLAADASTGMGEDDAGAAATTAASAAAFRALAGLGRGGVFGQQQLQSEQDGGEGAASGAAVGRAEQGSLCGGGPAAAVQAAVVSVAGRTGLEAAATAATAAATAATAATAAPAATTATTATTATAAAATATTPALGIEGAAAVAPWHAAGWAAAGGAAPGSTPLSIATPAAPPGLAASQRRQGGRGRGSGDRRAAARAGTAQDTAAPGGGGEQYGDGSWPPAPSRPTHFLALRLSHAATVTQAIDRVHQSLLAHHPSLDGFLEPSVKAHLTLMVMPLHEGPLLLPQQLQQPPPPPPPEPQPQQQPLPPQQQQPPQPQQPGQPQQQQIAAAVASALPWRLVCCLQRMAELPGALQAAGVDRPLTLCLRGLDAFGSRVLFLEVAPYNGGRSGADGGGDGGSGADGAGEGGGECSRQAVLRLQAAVAAHFRELRFDEADRPYAPHVTVAKVKRGREGNGGGGKGRSVLPGEPRSSRQRQQQEPQQEGAEAGASAAGGSAGSCADPHDCPAACEPAAAPAPANTGPGCSAPSGRTDAAPGGAAAAEPARAVPAQPATTASMDDQQADPTRGEAGREGAAAAAMFATVSDEYDNQIVELGLKSGPLAGAAAARKAPLQGIPREAYESHLGIDAGCVLVDRVQLCAMSGRPPGCYYRVLAEVALGAGGGGWGAAGGSRGGGEAGQVEGGSPGIGEGGAVAEACTGGGGGCKPAGSAGEAEVGSDERDGGGAGQVRLGQGEAGGSLPGLHPAVWLSEEAMALVRAAKAAAAEAGTGSCEPEPADCKQQQQEERGTGCAVM